MYGIYISFPFCRQKCTYCNFASGVFTAELQAAYLEALRQEILASGKPGFDTLYLGGGTPTFFSAENLKQLEPFYWAATLGSFTAAADENGLSQSAASQVVHQLEERLGTQLLDRSRRPFGVACPWFIRTNREQSVALVPYGRKRRPVRRKSGT